MIRTLLLDADGVVQRFDPATWSAIVAMTPRSDKQGFVTAIMEAERPCLSGLSAFPVAFARVLEDWECHASPEEGMRLWNEVQTDSGVLDIVSSVRRLGIRCCLASNQQPARALHMSTVLGYAEVFDREFYSHELGIAKPDVAYFATILQSLAEPANVVLFVDDNAQNVEAAAGLGIQAECFPANSGAATLQRLLGKYGVSVA